MGETIPSWAVKGAKVTPVNDIAWPSDYAWEQFPAFGQVYTIRAVEVEDDGVYLLLDEVRNRPFAYEEGGFGEANFAIEEFRPVVSDSDELGIETILYRKKGLKSKASVREEERA